MKLEEYNKIKDKTIQYFNKANIVLTDKEKNSIEVADFGLNDIENIGLQLITYINTDRVCAKEMVLFPNQTCPEHKHVDTDGMQGKEETFRCRYGQVFLYVEGPANNDNVVLPKTPVTVFHEVVLNPGEQYTIMPHTKHWFRGGPNGAIVSEFSTRSTDHTDVFTDNRVVRAPSVE